MALLPSLRGIDAEEMVQKGEKRKGREKKINHNRKTQKRKSDVAQGPVQSELEDAQPLKAGSSGAQLVTLEEPCRHPWELGLFLTLWGTSAGSRPPPSLHTRPSFLPADGELTCRTSGRVMRTLEW